MCHPLDEIVHAQKQGEARGLSSICSAHPWVLKTVLRGEAPALIESTCNQVNQFGGYTGMTPVDFVRYVRAIAAESGFSLEKMLLGGDHLGPLPWASEPAEAAMQKAAEMVRAYVQAGFTKIHLDCSMPLGGERELPLEVIARRTADLAKIAEQALDSSYPSSTTHRPLRYVIGSEVPPAGGAKAGEDHLAVTAPEAAAATLDAVRRAFREQGLEAAWERVRALVVQPGVEFGDETVHEYDRAAAAPLARFIETVPGLVYEAHSTDYQTRKSLSALVRDHFAILKVGPALTFAFRAAVFALAAIEGELLPPEARSNIAQVLEKAMLRNPIHWEKYYRGDEQARRLKRKFSLSDRVRYYWNEPDVQAAFKKLLDNLERAAPIPLTLIRQYLPEMVSEIHQRRLENRPSAIVARKIETVLDDYRAACNRG